MRMIYVVNVGNHPEENKAFNTYAAAKCYLFEIFRDNFPSWYEDAVRDGENIYGDILKDLTDMVEYGRIDDYADIVLMELVED